jgi:predicted DCC family thiol-disulfide oxidoreductase YuxK
VNATEPTRVEGRVGTAPARPGRPTLIYDASCGFCRRWVARLAELDRDGRVRLLPLQDDGAPAIAGRPREVLELAVHLVQSDGAVFAGAAVARELAPSLRGGWILALMMRMPGGMWLAARLYAWVARRWGPMP